LRKQNIFVRSTLSIFYFLAPFKPAATGVLNLILIIDQLW